MCFNKKICYNRSVHIYYNSQDAILQLQKTRYMAPILIFLNVFYIKEQRNTKFSIESEEKQCLLSSGHYPGKDLLR